MQFVTQSGGMWKDSLIHWYNACGAQEPRFNIDYCKANVTRILTYNKTKIEKTWGSIQ